MKKKNFFALLAQAGFALAAALLISIGLASCSKDKNKVEEGVIDIVTTTDIGGEIVLRVGKGEESLIVVDGADKVNKPVAVEGEWLKITYKLTKQSLSVKGKFTAFNCSFCRLTSLDVSKHKNLKNLVCSSNSALGTLDVSNNKQLTHLDCSACALGTLDLSKNPKLKHLNCFSNSELSGDDSLKMPDVRGIGGGTLYFKANSETKRKLSQAKVKTLKEDLGWEVFFYKDSRWQAYDGED